MQTTKIQYADFVSNPIRARVRFTQAGEEEKTGYACVKHGEGCLHCWAESVNVRFGTGLKYNVQNLGETETYLDELELEKVARFKLHPPFKFGRKFPVLFMGDMTDLFGGWVVPHDLDKVYFTICERKDIQFYLSTKRAESLLAYHSFISWVGSCCLEAKQNTLHAISIATQRDADEAYQSMMQVARLGWKVVASYEPAIETVNWTGWDFLAGMIVGPETGQGARPMPPDAFGAAYLFCEKRSIPLFRKDDPARFHGWPAMGRAE